MSYYVDGFIAPVKKVDKAKYIEFAKTMVPIFKDYGALKIVENWADDVPDGKLTSLPMAVKLEEDEVVVYSWITWPSKAVRDEGWQKLEQDPRMANQDTPMPFDGKRMIFGGFENVLDA